jgi:hypothetical protein
MFSPSFTELANYNILFVRVVFCEKSGKNVHLSYVAESRGRSRALLI